MPKFNMCFDMSGIVERTVEADTLEKAEEIAIDQIYNSDWNEMSCVEIALVDHEVEDADD